LSQFGKQRKRATEKYIDFVREGIGLPSIWKNLSNPVFLGDEAFVDQYQKIILEKTELDEVPALQKRAPLKTISYFQAKYEDTNIAIKEAYLTGGNTMKEIGQHFGKHYTTISRIIKRCE
jgi:putative transposase